MQYKDYYKTLGVPKDANEKDIKKAYRQRARQYHPDTHPGDKSAEETFKEVNEAYEVLSDAEKRRTYDQFGSQWQQYQGTGGNPQDFWRQWSPQGGGPRSQGSNTQTRTVSPEEFDQMFGGGGAGGLGGFSDFFETLFGRGQAGGGFDSFRQAQPRPTRGRDAEHGIDVTLEEAYSGTTRMLQIDDERIEVSIPRGVKTGSRVRVAGKGAPGAGGGAPGDLHLRVNVVSNPLFTREESDLRVKVPVDMYTLVLGGEVHVPTLERPVVLTIPAGTPNGKVFRLRGLGMPHLRQPDQRGDLYAVIEAQVPQNLSENEIDLFRQLRALRQG